MVMRENEILEATGNTEIKGVIYKATNIINGKVYIGMTTRGLEVRRTQHIRDARYRSNPANYFGRAIRKYGEDVFNWDVIDESVKVESLYEKEVYWISHYNSFGVGGYNMTKGGEGTAGHVVTEESKKRQSERMIKAHASGHYDGVNLRGSEHQNSILIEEEAIIIKDLLIENELTYKEIGEFFGVTSSTIYAIRQGLTWKHVVSEEDRAKIEEVAPTRIRNTDEQAIRVKDLLIEGFLSHKEISSIVEVSIGAVSSIKYGSSKSHLFTENEIELLREGVFAHLTEDDAIGIKNLLIENIISQNEIAKRFNVDDAVVSRIKSGERWSYLFSEEELQLMDNRGEKHKGLNEKEVLEIVQHLKEGVLTLRELRVKYGVGETSIGDILRGRSWKSIVSNKDLEDMEKTFPKQIKNEKKKRKYAKLTAYLITEIKQALFDGNMKQYEIAKKFRVAGSTVSQIKTGKIE